MNTNRNITNYSDQELIDGCLRRDRVLQKALYDQYKTSLFTLIYRLYPDKETANDILQDSLIEIFGSLKNFKSKSSLYTWMRSIVIRQTMGKVKEQYKLQIVDKEVPETEVEGNYDFTTKHLEEAIQSLPENARAVFILVEVEGYKHKEVAEMLNISVGTSKSQLNYSKKLLRQRLNPIEHEKRI